MILRFPLLILLLFSGISIGGDSETTTEDPTLHLVIAEQFIDAFYSFNTKSLSALLSSAIESQPGIIYYQGWAKGGHYEIVHREPCKMENPRLIGCSITVEDDLMIALGIDFNVTDTFHLSFSKEKISHVATSSNDLQVFRDAEIWVQEHLPELITEPCRGYFNGGSTPGLCVQAMVKGYGIFAASADFPALQ